MEYINDNPSVTVDNECTNTVANPNISHEKIELFEDSDVIFDKEYTYKELDDREKICGSIGGGKVYHNLTGKGYRPIPIYCMLLSCKKTHDVDYRIKNCYKTLRKSFSPNYPIYEKRYCIGEAPNSRYDIDLIYEKLYEVSTFIQSFDKKIMAAARVLLINDEDKMYWVLLAQLQNDVSMSIEDIDEFFNVPFILENVELELDVKHDHNLDVNKNYIMSYMLNDEKHFNELIKKHVSWNISKDLGIYVKTAHFGIPINRKTGNNSEKIPKDIAVPTITKIDEDGNEQSIALFSEGIWKNEDEINKIIKYKSMPKVRFNNPCNVHYQLLNLKPVTIFEYVNEMRKCGTSLDDNFRKFFGSEENFQHVLEIIADHEMEIEQACTGPPI